MLARPASEQRHAQLAFRFIRWALARAPAAVRASIEAALTSNAVEDGRALAVAYPCLEALLAVTPASPVELASALG